LINLVSYWWELFNL